MRIAAKFSAVFLGWLVMLASQCAALDLQAKIDPLAQPLVDDGVVVGMVVGIVQGDQTQILAYGETKKHSGIAPDGNSVFENGSVTKVFTGVLLADSVRAGRLQLDDPVQQHIPDGVKLPIHSEKPMTLRHLATHTSGLLRMPENFQPQDASQPYVDYKREQLFEFLGKHKLRRQPGKYEYSNLAMGLLGEVLADQHQGSYEQAIQKRILKPLNMTDTSITLSRDQRKRLVPGYNAALKDEPAWDFAAMAGAGAMRSTCNDMLKFMQANLAEDEEPITLALRDAHVKQPFPKQHQAMGLGWHIAGDGITRWHNGMTGGYHCWLAVVPDHDIGVVVLANTATMRVTAFGEQVTRIAFGANVKPPERRQEIEVAADVLEEYVGRYQITPEFELVVSLEEGKLMVQATGQPKVQVFAESATRFFYKVVDAQITFVPDDNGQISKLVLHQFGRDIEAARRK